MTNIEELMQASKWAIDDLHKDEEYLRQVRELKELIEEENRRNIYRIIHGISKVIIDNRK